MHACKIELSRNNIEEMELFEDMEIAAHPQIAIS